MRAFQPQSQSRRSLTGEDGTFAVGALDEAETFTVSASYSLGGSVHVEGARAGQNVELTLPALCKLGGVARNADGSSAQYFRITVSNPAAGQQLSTELGPEADGQWSIDRVAWGDVEVVAVGPVGAASERVALAPGQQPLDLALTLAPQMAALP